MKGTVGIYSHSCFQLQHNLLDHGGPTQATWMCQIFLKIISTLLGHDTTRKSNFGTPHPATGNILPGIGYYSTIAGTPNQYL